DRPFGSFDSTWSANEMVRPVDRRRRGERGRRLGGRLECLSTPATTRRDENQFRLQRLPRTPRAGGFHADPRRKPRTRQNFRSATRNEQITNRHLHPALDGRAIQQALVNLLDNAIKHSPSGTSVQVGLGIDGVAASRESAAVLPFGEPGPVKSPAQEVSGGFP